MAAHARSLDNDITRLKPANKMLGLGLMGIGLVAIVVALLFSLFVLHDDRPGEHVIHYDGAQRFFWAYLFGITGFLAISCSALMFTLINHLVRAGWVVNVRRVLETIAFQLPLLSILLIPIVATVVAQNGLIYSWAVPTTTPIAHHGDSHDNAGGHGESHDAPHGNEKPHPQDKAAHQSDTGDTNQATAQDDASKQAKDVSADHGGAVPADPGDGERREPQGPTKNEQGQVTAVDPSAGGTPRKEVQTDAVGHEMSDREGKTPGIAYPNEQVRPGVERHYDPLIAGKTSFWLNPIIWAIRIPIYFIILSVVAWHYYKQSVKQDATGDIDISTNLMTLSAPLTFVCGLLVTFVAFDVFMSLDPHWFSTMYGVYFFATGTQALWAVMALTFIVLQKRGYVRQSVTEEHYHDMGKWLWAFIVFFAYIAFSQYMLQWYANLPEETFWYDKRGYSSAHPNGYTPLVFWGLFVGRLVIPFLGLVSRHVKRNKFGLGFWAVWLLVMFFVDIYHLIMPEYTYTPLFGIPEILCLIGFAGLWGGNIIRTLATAELRPVREPRAHESLALQHF
ncbi:MAG TPA: hypothetical protein VGB55_15855 [Tepidisphaeraceae bacterium]